MRKGKRFTPQLIRQFRAAGRGTGVYKEYIPWHMVTRNDPASGGLSHHQKWAKTDRIHHFLSNVELKAFLFATMMSEVVDLREQFPLSLHSHQVEISAYLASRLGETAPGTLELAGDLGIKHPMRSEHGDSEIWVLTTDILLAIRSARGTLELLAISVKLDESLKKRRTQQKLMLERDYWVRQGVNWLLITPRTFSKQVGDSIYKCRAWALDENPVCPEKLALCSKLQFELEGKSLTETLQCIGKRLNIDMDGAQRAFWQCVWSGALPIDLGTSFRPGTPIHFLDREKFLEQNPIAMRRSTCL